VSIIGESERWRAALRDKYEIISQAINRAWPDCRARIRATGPGTYLETQAYEDPITRYLIVLLRRDRVIRDSPLFIESQRELLSEEPERGVVPEGYIDIGILFFLSSHKLCLALECKRLNVIRHGVRATLAGQYVREGMMRFVTGQYSPDLSLGGMVGYVMDGEMAAAYRAIKDKIAEHSDELLCDPGRIADAGQPHQFSTEHNRPVVPIELRHLLLSAM
jgi:hypothetical protein